MPTKKCGFREILNDVIWRIMLRKWRGMKCRICVFKPIFRFCIFLKIVILVIKAKRITFIMRDLRAGAFRDFFIGGSIISCLITPDDADRNNTRLDDLFDAVTVAGANTARTSSSWSHKEISGIKMRADMFFSSFSSFLTPSDFLGIALDGRWRYISIRSIFSIPSNTVTADCVDRFRRLRGPFERVASN